MSNTIKFDPAPGGATKENRVSTELTGTIANVIGTGPHARTNIVYKTVGWSFLGGALCTVAVAVFSYICDDKQFFIEGTKAIWAIFIPLITLSLGYVFGRGEAGGGT